MARYIGSLRSYLFGVLFGSFILGMFYCISSYASHLLHDSPSQVSMALKQDMLKHSSHLEIESKRNFLTYAGVKTSLPKVVLTMMECPTGKSVLEPSVLAKLDCKKRLPQVIGIGVEKCGTGALSFFLSSHPSLKHANPYEIYYWNKNQEKDFEWYREQMPVSSKYQVTMEKTPSYIFEKDLPERIRATMPQTKFIVIVRDPIVRAVSDYLHLKSIGRPEYFTPRIAPPGAEPLCYVNTTFEGSVIKPNGDVNSDNGILAHSAYVLYLKRWIQVFPRRQFLIIDGDEFVRNPLPILHKVETFLDIPKYFNKNFVYFDEEKGFFCKYNRGMTRTFCEDKTKGVPHPDVDENVIRKLRSYFRSYNTQLEKMVGKRFSWSE